MEKLENVIPMVTLKSSMLIMGF